MNDEKKLPKCLLKKKNVFFRTRAQNRPERTIKRTNDSDHQSLGCGSARKRAGGLYGKFARYLSFSRAKWRKRRRHKRDRYLVVVVVVVVVVGGAEVGGGEQ